MRYDHTTIAQTPATTSENISRGLFTEIVGKTEWRCYSSTESNIEPLLDRFMNGDARVPSILSGDTYALVPMQVFRFEHPSGMIEGWLYLNGAVVVSKANEEIIFLFIDNDLAVTESYPEDVFEYRTELKEGNQKDE